ncbi:MAG: transposase [Flavobacteriales bacterium]|nr:transposase [Flavobacteriales bacterium]
MGIRKVNTIGIQQANKVMLLAGAAYNLKKLMKYTYKKVKTKANQLENTLYAFYLNIRLKRSLLKL